MKTVLLLSVLSGVVCLSCTDKGRSVRLENQVNTRDSLAVSEVKYELPECELWYTSPLFDREGGLRLWTEHEVYPENVQAINVFVANPTDIPLSFGRATRILQWKNGQWTPPEQKDKTYILAVPDDAFVIQEAPLLYCFHCRLDDYHIPPGRYCVRKLFSQGKNLLCLTDTFEVK